MAIEIIINKEPPKELIRIIEEEYGPEDSIEKVIIEANSERVNDTDAIAGYFPDTKEIIIDLAHCVENKGWMGFGMMMVQTVWFNMLRAVFHELGHALQLDRDPTIKDMAILTPHLEHEADSFATIMIQEWASNGGIIPKIDDMGWASEQIKLIVNTCYGNKQLQPKIMEELAVLEANGVAELDTFAACNTETISKESYNDLCDVIDQKEHGIKINNKRYLNPVGFFEGLTNQTDKDKEWLMTGMRYEIFDEPPEKDTNKVLTDDIVK